MWTENDEEDWIHEVREQISKETEGMSPEERVRYYEDASAEIISRLKLRQVRDCRDTEKPAA